MTTMTAGKRLLFYVALTITLVGVTIGTPSTKRNEFTPREHRNLMDKKPSRAEQEEEILKMIYSSKDRFNLVKKDERPSEVVGQLIDADQTGILQGVTCKLCSSAVGALEDVVHAEVTPEKVIQVLSELCTDLHLFSSPVCNGALEIFTEEVMYILNATQSPTNEMCTVLFFNICGDVTTSHHNWTVELPDTIKPPIEDQKPVAGSKRLKVLHISDTHFDMEYLIGSNAECADPACCQDVSGEPASEAAKAGKWGDYRNCDTPEATFDSMLSHITTTHQDLDYVVWTGDLPPHHVWKQSKESNLKVINTTISKIFQAFPNTPVYPALGNHEAYPCNNYSPPGSDERWSMSWLYDILDQLWQHWLPSTVSSTVKFGAYYNVVVKPGLRMISLNMNYCYNMNFWLMMDSSDIAQELKWLITQLQSAEDNGEKVHIIGHIPPGNSDCIKKWSENYYKIIYRYESTVRGQFFGHTHKDHFQLFYDMEEYKRPTAVSYIGPSLTTYSFLNPAYRIYYVDGDHEETTWSVVEHETWYLNLEEANAQDNPVWRMLYNTKNDYNMETLTPDDWNNFLERIIDDQSLFDLYLKHYYRDSPRWEPCETPECRYDFLCTIRSGRSHFTEVLCQDLEERLKSLNESWIQRIFHKTYKLIWDH